tara:strand:+ start:72 stop:1157 length:1086 start_codon:yes stop_codon:yes gene_type:complete
MIPVTKTCLPELDDYVSQLSEIWKSGWLTNNGAYSKKLTSDLISYLNVSNLELIGNGTLAIQLAIQALDLTGEIITTPYSYVATTTAILWENCDPVFVDINRESMCIDPDLIEDAITEKTSAIIATHVYGLPCDVAKIEQIARKYQLKVIYDAAHCFGVKYGGQSLLNYGDCSTISFHATKLFHTVEGGAVVCADKHVAERIFLSKKFGHVGEDDYFQIGINAKLSEFHAAMGVCMLPLIDSQIQRRKQISQSYDHLLEGCEITRPVIPADLEYNYSYYPVVFKSHTAMSNVRQALLDQDVMTRRYFYPSLNTLNYLRPELKMPCPISEEIADRVLCIPLHAELQQTDLEKISHLILREIK